MSSIIPKQNINIPSRTNINQIKLQYGEDVSNIRNSNLFQNSNFAVMANKSNKT